VLDLGASEQSGLTEDPAEGLVAELTAHAVEDGSPAHAAAEIRRRGAVGEMPIGMYRLSEVLAPVSAAVPAQRVPDGEPGEVVEVVRQYPCAVLDASSPAKVAENLAAVLRDGKRVLVSGVDAEALSAVRDALPAPLHGLCLDSPPPLSDAELRELRSLLVTATPGTRVRLGQALPNPNLVPTADRVAALCRAAGGRGYPPRDGVDLLPELLGGLDSGRLAALMDTARRCMGTLAALDPRGDAEWTGPLLERVLLGSGREKFDSLLRRTTDVVLSADMLRDAGDQMAVVGALPPGAVDQLRAYVNYLDAGGRARLYFRSPQQKAVQPVLRHLRLDGLPLKDSTALHHALAFVELIEAMDTIGAHCRALQIPEPRNVPGVAELNRQLDRVEEAARAAEHLRHEVLFIHPTSPVPVPDLHAVEHVARTIVETGGESAMARARDELTGLADRLWRSMPPSGVAPEFGVLVGALREMSLPAYLDAQAMLAAARREQADQRRQEQLLGRLRAAAPGLAALWEEEGPRRFTQGTARFVPLDELLDGLPAADTADLVLLLGAGSLGAENLLVAAAAPRLVAVSTGFASTPPAPAGGEDTVLDTLRRAGVPVIVAGGDGAAASPEVPAQPAASAAPAHAPSAPAYVEMPAPPPGVSEVPPPPLDLAVDTSNDMDAGDGAADGPAPPFTVPAQREAPTQEADPSGRVGNRRARASGSVDEPTEQPEVETEYVVLPLGIVARPVESADDRGDDQRAGA